MLNIEFSAKEDAHNCEVSVEAPWIVFTCPQCQNYRRKMHQETGEMVVENPGDPQIKHQGMYINPLILEASHSLS